MSVMVAPRPRPDRAGPWPLRWRGRRRWRGDDEVGVVGAGRPLLAADAGASAVAGDLGERVRLAPDQGGRAGAERRRLPDVAGRDGTDDRDAADRPDGEDGGLGGERQAQGAGQTRGQGGDGEDPEREREGEQLGDSEQRGDEQPGDPRLHSSSLEAAESPLLQSNSQIAVTAMPWGSAMAWLWPTSHHGADGPVHKENSRWATARRFVPVPSAKPCAIERTLDDAGTVTRVWGDEKDPFSKGFICPKGATLGSLDGDPDRLAEPLVNGETAGWDEAFEAVRKGSRTSSSGMGGTRSPSTSATRPRTRSPGRCTAARS